ncbi:hypothetical protein JQK15_15535 [Sphingobium sp. BHU LFT2]|uniref:DUF2231 domain-containing protein n=1 Tax=Sphingobium sp. BHU LFT2 TaxID=2807634 RepID=UPI001BEB223E|nr:DUF2231 domain-containing protein [Sphingobium sp. BHU LFT2]MBT2244954.1 hypothetical protein [Sphingobium sp. BHU LFT2]
MPSAPPRTRPLLHPLHGLLLAWPVALFPAALLSDITYLNSAEIQWSNFSAWLITGALIGGGLVLLWALIALARAEGPARRQHGLYLLLLALMWVCGLINAFQHSRDGWSSVGTIGLILSLLSSLAALAAGWVAFAGYREVRP